MQYSVAQHSVLCAQAALFAGCRFFGGYPITPATEIMQHLQRDIWRHGGSLLQAATIDAVANARKSFLNIE